MKEEFMKYEINLKKFSECERERKLERSWDMRI